MRRWLRLDAQGSTFLRCGRTRRTCAYDNETPRLFFPHNFIPCSQYSYTRNVTRPTRTFAFRGGRLGWDLNIADTPQDCNRVKAACLRTSFFDFFAAKLKGFPSSPAFRFAVGGGAWEGSIGS